MKGLEQVFNVQYSVLLKFEWMYQTVVRISPNHLSPEHADAPHTGNGMYAQQLLAIVTTVTVGRSSGVWHLLRPFFWLGRGNDLQPRVGHQLFRLTIAFVLGPSDVSG
jgi:hypothetical protein